MSQNSNQAVAILGRQPAIGLAELESLYGAERITPLGKHAALIDIDPAEISFARIGGTIKLAKLLTILDFTDWRKLSDYLIEHVPKHTCCIGPGKVTFGISVYGIKTNEQLIQRTALEVKKAIKKSDERPVRVVPTKGLELNSAQVLHNKMTQLPFGMELIFVATGGKTYLAQTVDIQDIEAYAARDQARPKRDAKIGMLPPKLAQTIVNLSGNNVSAMSQNEAEKTTTPGENRLARILDPFCGTGVILQEALLMGFDVIGSDLEPRMVAYSQENLEWLKSDIRVTGSFTLSQGDATEMQWETPFDGIACETYLGRAFSHEPKPEVLREVMSDVDTIHKKFLQNVTRQTKPGFRMTIAIPSWKIGNEFKHLQILDHLEELGYTRVSFKYAADQDLIYHREGQFVGRELVTLIRK